MFKENRELWGYVIGIVIMFFVLFFGIQFFIDTNSLLERFGLISKKNETQEETIIEKPGNNLDTNLDYFAIVKTNKGEFQVELFEKSAPNTVNNFIFLATKNYYTGTKFHRLIEGVLLQGGSRNTFNEDPSDDGFGGPGYIFDDEINWDSLNLSVESKTNLENAGYTSQSGLISVAPAKYILAMANAGQPNTNGSQFFIVLGNADDESVKNLAGRHTVFGEVVVNKELIDEFAGYGAAETAYNTPLQDIIIEKVEIFVRS